MADNQIKTVFSGFRQYGRDAVGGEILKLVGVKIKIFSLLLRNIGSRESRHLKFGN